MPLQYHSPPMVSDSQINPIHELERLVTGCAVFRIQSRKRVSHREGKPIMGAEDKASNKIDDLRQG